MLSRPEIGTKSHILLWLAGKPENEVFPWPDRQLCACGQYWREHFPEQNYFAWASNSTLMDLNDLLGGVVKEKQRPRITWGEAHAATSNAWSDHE